MIYLAKQLFRKKERSAIPIYTKRFETLEKLIADDRIGIDFEQKLVVLDVSIHVLYIGKDREYAAFFDTVQAYMNMCRGALGIRELIESNDRINFMVVMKKYQSFNMETAEFFDPAKETTKTLLVGYYQNEKVEYCVYEEDKKE